MKRTCNDIWERIVELAEGQPQPEASAHLTTCTECRAKFGELGTMLQGMAVPHFKAPESLLQEAKSLMPVAARRMGLIRTSLQLSGARSENQDFQAVYGADDLELRVMYSKVERGWDVIGQIPNPLWSVARGNKEIPVDSEGRFHFLTKTLDDSSFSLDGGQLRLEVPSATEAIREPGNDS